MTSQEPTGLTEDLVRQWFINRRLIPFKKEHDQALRRILIPLFRRKFRNDQYLVDEAYSEMILRIQQALNTFTEDPRKSYLHCFHGIIWFHLNKVINRLLTAEGKLGKKEIVLKTAETSGHDSDGGDDDTPTVIAGLSKESRFSEAGARKGDRLLAIDGIKIRSPNQARALLDALSEGPRKLEINRGDQRLTVEVDLRDRAWYDLFDRLGDEPARTEAPDDPKDEEQAMFRMAEEAFGRIDDENKKKLVKLRYRMGFSYSEIYALDPERFKSKVNARVKTKRALKEFFTHLYSLADEKARQMKEVSREMHQFYSVVKQDAGDCLKKLENY